MSELTRETTIIGEPEVVEDVTAVTPAWLSLKQAVTSLRAYQIQDGSIPDTTQHPESRELVSAITREILNLQPAFPHDAAYLTALVADFARWASEGFGVPDFYDSLVAFDPAAHRVNGLRHLVVFPMYTQNGSTDRLVEAVLIEVIWPEFVSELEAGNYSNKLFVPIRFVDFTAGYDTNSAVLFPETVAVRETPKFTWGAIFADREAARFRRVVKAASDITGLEMPADAAELLTDQSLAEETFVMWDLIHDRTHMRGDLPFDPFMIKQRMPYFLYSLEELRCDLTAFRESVALVRALEHKASAISGTRRDASADDRHGRRITEVDADILKHAQLVQYAVIFDRIFRFALTGNRVRNYDGLGGQLLFAWMHQHHVLHWTDTKLSIDWAEVPDVVNALGEAIGDLYWRSIDRPKIAHWLAAHDLVSATLTPHPASKWAARDLTLDGLPKDLTNAVLDDEFPLSMFYEALSKKMTETIESTAGITGNTD